MTTFIERKRNLLQSSNERTDVRYRPAALPVRGQQALPSPDPAADEPEVTK